MTQSEIMSTGAHAMWVAMELALPILVASLVLAPLATAAALRVAED